MPDIQRALMLLRQGRFDLAESELRGLLADDPHDPLPHGYLALCLAGRELYEPALEEARTTVGLMPDLPWAHYVMAQILFDMDRYVEADQALEEAIQLDPEDADFFALRSNIRLQQGKWKEALAAAEQGLEIDARHTTCANLRGMALVKLGRKKEAEATLEGVLAQDPENALSHANQGWTQLERNNPKRALEHFREALRIDPNLDWARAGIVEALKARNPIYRVMLQYFLFMGKLSDKAQWIVIIGIVVGRRVLSSIARTMPEFQPFITPILVALFVFLYLTWVAGPLFNLSLRLNRFGWYALTREQRNASRWVGLSYLGAMITGILTGISYWQRWPIFLPAALALGYFLILVIPISATYQVPAGGKRVFMGVITGLLAMVGASAVLAQLVVPGTDGIGDPGIFTLGLALLFLIGSVATTWIVLFLPKGGG